MATKLLDPTEVDLTQSRRALILVWQNPSTRRFVKVGRIDALPDYRFAFQYLPSAADDAQFTGLDEFPRRDAIYLSDEVPAFFANRVLSSERRGYDHYLRWLGLTDVSVLDIPFEFLARTGGGRATDTFHVVDLPLGDEETFSSRFFISGIRYIDDADEVVGGLRPGAPLSLALEPSNVKNPRAVLVNTVDGTRVGYVPDWLCADVYRLIEERWGLVAVAEQVNPDAPPHVQVLCRVDAHR